MKNGDNNNMIARLLAPHDIAISWHGCLWILSQNEENKINWNAIQNIRHIHTHTHMRAEHTLMSAHATFNTQHLISSIAIDDDGEYASSSHTE